MSSNNSSLVELTENPAADPARNCRHLETGRILYFPTIPYSISEDDRDFLLGQQQTGSRFHKNISYRPVTDILNGMDGNSADRQRTHQIMQRFSKSVADFVQTALAPYHLKLKMDYASFRPFEEEGRDLPLHKRNDLLHVDAFPTRPTRGARILRVFANINRTEPRVWNIGQPFHELMPELSKTAAPKFRSPAVRVLAKLASNIGLPVADRAPYDEYMLYLHHWMKEQSAFQESCPKQRLEFPAGSGWMVFTDGVPHAVLHGRYALEQTFIVPASALVSPEVAPIRVLEQVTGRSMSA